MHAGWVLLRNAGFQEALAEDPIGEAASWSEVNTWTAQDQAEVDALLPKGDFSCKGMHAPTGPFPAQSSCSIAICEHLSQDVCLHEQLENGDETLLNKAGCKAGNGCMQSA